MGDTLDAKTKKALHTLITDAKRRELQYVEALLHSATAAALQVLEKRVEWLEEGKSSDDDADEFDIRDFFLDVLIDLLIGEVAGKLLKESMESVVRPIVRSRQAFYVVPKIKKKGVKLKVKAALRLDKSELKAARKAAKKKLEEHLMRVLESDDYSAFVMVPEMLLNSTLNTGIASAQDAITVSTERVDPHTTRAGDTATVKVWTTVQDFYSTQKAAVEKLYDDLLAELLFGEIDAETGEELKGFLEENRSNAVTSQQERRTLEDQYQLFYEACMWAYYLEVGGLVSERTPSNESLYGAKRGDQIANDPKWYKLEKADDDGVRFTKPTFYAHRHGRDTRDIRKTTVTVGVPKRYFEYWIDRFPHTFGDPQSKSIGDYYNDRESYRDPGETRTKYIAVRAYEDVLSQFQYLARKLDASFSAMQIAGTVG